MSKTGLDFLFSIVPKPEISHFWDVSPVNHDLWWVRHWICSEDDGFYIPVGRFVFPSVSFPTDIDQLVDQQWYTKCMGAWVNLQKGNSLFNIPKNAGKVQFWIAKPRLEELDIFQAQLLVGPGGGFLATPTFPPLLLGDSEVVVSLRNQAKSWYC